MRLKIAYYGTPVLREKCQPVKKVTKEIQKLAEDMLETMEIENGIGLAAPQVHHSLRLFVTCVPIPAEDDTWDPGFPRVFINPTITSFSEETDTWSEGCLSIPGINGDVKRPIAVTVEATGLDGKTFTETFKGLEARCILHENDHINGKLFIDRLDKTSRKAIESDLRALKKKYS